MKHKLDLKIKPTGNKLLSEEFLIASIKEVNGIVESNEI